MTSTRARILIFLLGSLTQFHTVYGIIREKNDSKLARKYGRNYFQEESEHQKTPKRYYVKTKGNKRKVKGDAEKAGGEVLYEFDSLELSVVKFDNVTDASNFAALGHSGAMEEDAPRYLMRIKGSEAPTSHAANDTGLDEEALRNLQSGGQVLPDGLKVVFQGSIPDASYYPSTNPSIPICIIDSGFAGSGHPDLQNVYASAADPYQSNNFWDDCGHGTHVAGTIVAENNNLGVLGIYPGASVMVVKVFGWNGSKCAWTYSSSIVAAANYCAATGAKIISMSLGGDIRVSMEESAFYSLRQKGILIFAAAGNEGANIYSYPASYSSVVSVAAIDQYYQRASFSQWNNMVDIAAPGVNVLSTTPYGRYATYSGTSMACPHVSGAAFLLWNKYPRCSGDQVLEAILSTARDLGTSGTDSSYGRGVIQFWSAASYLAARCG